MTKSGDTSVSLEELQELELLRSVDMHAVAPLLRDCPVRVLHEREILICAGDDNRYLFLVLSGRLSVRLSSPNDLPLTHLGRGESVGELSLIDRKPTSAFVVAEETTRVLLVDEELLWMLANTSHAISTNLLFTLAKRMRFGNDVIFQDREQLREYRFHATVDGLTGLFNRHWLNKMLPRLMDRAWKQGEPMALIMLDIDHFKPYNDKYGHIAGDHALCAVAASLREHLRPGDMAARFGGEEILVLLPDSSLADSEVVAERLRAAVERTEVVYPNGDKLPSVTVSAGAAGMPAPGPGPKPEIIDPEQFVSVADAALYRAKRAGRNRVET